MWFLVLEAQKSLLCRRRDPASLREESNVTPCSAPRPVQKQNSESPDPEMPRHGMRPWTIVTSAAALIWRVWARDLRHMNAFFFVPALVGTASNTLFETHVLEDNFLFAVLWLTKIEAFCWCKHLERWSTMRSKLQAWSTWRWFGQLGWLRRPSLGHAWIWTGGCRWGNFWTWDGVQVQVVPPHHWHHHLNDSTQKFTSEKLLG